MQRCKGHIPESFKLILLTSIWIHSSTPTCKSLRKYARHSNNYFTGFDTISYLKLLETMFIIIGYVKYIKLVMRSNSTKYRSERCTFPVIAAIPCMLTPSKLLTKCFVVNRVGVLLWLSLCSVKWYENWEWHKLPNMHQFYVNSNHIKFITDDNQNVLSVNINYNLCASF